MLVNFTKMHGLGNDFVVIDLITQNVKLNTAHIRRIADRHFGVGCDQVILIEPPLESDVHFSYRIFNADGQEVQQCGNGARCAARFFYDSGYVHQTTFKADCLAGQIEFKIEGDSIVVNMGKPNFEPHSIPINMPTFQTLYSAEYDRQEIQFSAVSIGNPHAVLVVPDIEQAPVQKLGAWLSNHPMFPEKANIGFMQILNSNTIQLRVFERGVGETLACGTGACAAALVGIQRQILKNPVTVVFSKGSLIIEWKGDRAPVYLTGPAVGIFVGRFRL